jgi:hypothetical protein
MAERCNAVVWRRDTYRRTGRGKSRFRMHYTKGQCKRAVSCGDLCRQHAKLDQAGWLVLRHATRPAREDSA